MSGAVDLASLLDDKDAAGRFRPTAGRVLVKRATPLEKTRGGLIIPEIARESGDEARVVAVGAGRLLKNGKRVPPAVKPGQRVLLDKWDGSKVVLGGVEHRVMDESLILAVVED